MTSRIVYLGAPEGFTALAEVIAGRAKLEHVEAEPTAVAEALFDASALLDASMKVYIDDGMIAAAPDLKVISCATTGSDHIDRGEAERRGIPIHTLREDRELLQNITPAAELSWALVLAAARRLPAALAHTREGGWTRENFPGLMLHGKRLGLIGCGRIGGWMARYGQAFGMTVVGYDPFIDTWPEGIQPTGLKELFESCDVISVHVHLSDETSGLVSAELLAGIKPGAIFINTSRGAIADEAALLEALESGRLGAAGLDVLEGEPEIADHPLIAYARSHDNLLITPHCGGFSPDAVRRVCQRAAEKILAALGLDT
ncbi:MAG: NAD(P)-dependent oxidoreductase [Alphaproteobacteria bacterium]|jgi:D-3-phosphoglycerate dehydrogenase|nr:hydroxyacid dehydrogenase [Rhodospirillaceae bacterium]MDP6405271.1 NAD(P)-dependent oxidoreductase [Alphaproteobacteria bacterium]